MQTPFPICTIGGKMMSNLIMQKPLKIADPIMQTPSKFGDPVMQSFLHLYYRGQNDVKPSIADAFLHLHYRGENDVKPHNADVFRNCRPYNADL